MRGLLLGGLLMVLPLASAQKVTPRLTGATVIDDLGSAHKAVQARAATLHDAKLQAVSKQLAHMRAALVQTLGDDTAAPLATVDKDERDAAVRADAAAKRVQAWLDASAVSCTRKDIDAMLAALSATLDRLAADTASQKAPLPVVQGVETLDRRPLFALRQGGGTPSFVLTGANLVDTQCANPEVVAVDAAGQPLAAASQPQVVAAQPTRVQLRWPGAAKLAPGSYVLQLTAQRKAFLFGCVSQPPAVAVLQIVPPMRFTLDYVLSAACAKASGPVTLGSGTLPALTAPGRTVSQTIDVSACHDPASYTVSATVRTADGHASSAGPITQNAGARITLGLGNGLTLSWDPSLHRLFARSGKRACKGVY